MPPIKRSDLTPEQIEIWHRILRWHKLYGNTQRGFYISKYMPFGNVCANGILARGKHMRKFVKRGMVVKITSDILSSPTYNISPKYNWVDYVKE